MHFYFCSSLLFIWMHIFYVGIYNAATVNVWSIPMQLNNFISFNLKKKNIYYIRWLKCTIEDNYVIVELIDVAI